MSPIYVPMPWASPRVEIPVEWVDAVREFINLPYNAEKNDLKSDFSDVELEAARYVCSIVAKRMDSGAVRISYMEATLLCRLYLTTVDKRMWPTLVGMNPTMDKALGQKLKG